MSVAAARPGDARQARDAYAAVVGSSPNRRPDELLDGPGFAPVDDAIDDLGFGGLLTRRAQARRFVADDGITYGTGRDGGQGRNWAIDPLPLVIGADDWAGIERGLRQRATLLDLVLTDLYGERTLVRDGILPPEAVAGHPGFVRAVDGLRTPGRHQLFHVATDVVRTGDGWQALSDRAQAPAGSGYAMATRRITSRVLPGPHREADLARLRGFFHTMSEGLIDLAPDTGELPRVVLLSPGSESDTAYDQAFLATLLGLPLVEAEDLEVREGRVYRRTTGREEAVDVILRRVDAEWCDPLDLRGDSQLGITGLVEAVRRGTVTVVNPLGSGVLENPVVAGRLGAAARHFLDEDLLLPTVPTLWCGDDAERREVLDRLDDLVVKPLARTGGVASIVGASLSGAERDELRARIDAEPWAWAAQERVAPSTAPVVTNHGLAPRELVLRTFAVGRPDAYHVMPGGLARVARVDGQSVISNSTGALAKDVWVLADGRSDEPVTRTRRAAPTRQVEGLAPRAAEDLFWLGRHAERAEATARLLRVADDLVEDNSRRPGTPGHAAMAAILRATTQVTRVEPGFEGPDADERIADPRPLLRTLMIDGEQTGTLRYCVDRLVRNAQGVREMLSLDTWVVLSHLERTLSEELPEDAALQPVLVRAQESLLALAGIMAQGMIRDETWAYIDAGTRLERAQHTVSLLRAALAVERPPVIDAQVTEAVLFAGESVITHRRRTMAGTGPSSPVSSTLQLLLLDAANPRSVAYQLNRLQEDLPLMSDSVGVAVCGELVGRLAEADVEPLGGHSRTELTELLDGLRDDLSNLSKGIQRRHFRRQAPRRRMASEWSGVTPRA